MTAQSSPHRMLALLLLLLSLGGIGLISLGAAADRGEIGVFVGERERDLETVSAARKPYEEADWETDEAPIPPEQRRENPLGLILGVAAVVLVLSVLAIWVLMRMRALAQPPLEVAGEDAEELTVGQARAALQEAQEHLSTVVDAQSAVIAAWLTLERTIAAVGIRRHPSQTTREYVVDVLSGLELDRSSLDSFAHLYRRALFDPSPLTEPDRDQALELLRALRADLDRAVGQGRR